MPMVFTGYEPGSKAYRVYDPTSRRLHVSCGVVFDKDVSWSWGQEADRPGGTFTIDLIVHAGATTASGGCHGSTRIICGSGRKPCHGSHSSGASSTPRNAAMAANTLEPAGAQEVEFAPLYGLTTPTTPTPCTGVAASPICLIRVRLTQERRSAFF